MRPQWCRRGLTALIAFMPRVLHLPQTLVESIGDLDADLKVAEDVVAAAV